MRAHVSFIQHNGHRKGSEWDLHLFCKLNFGLENLDPTLWPGIPHNALNTEHLFAPLVFRPSLSYRLNAFDHQAARCKHFNNFRYHICLSLSFLFLSLRLMNRLMHPSFYNSLHLFFSFGFHKIS